MLCVLSSVVKTGPSVTIRSPDICASLDQEFDYIPFTPIASEQ
jgi:hypothetical protein